MSENTRDDAMRMSKTRTNEWRVILSFRPIRCLCANNHLSSGSSWNYDLFVRIAPHFTFTELAGINKAETNYWFYVIAFLLSLCNGSGSMENEIELSLRPITKLRHRGFILFYLRYPQEPNRCKNTEYELIKWYRRLYVYRCTLNRRKKGWVDSNEELLFVNNCVKSLKGQD